MNRSQRITVYLTIIVLSLIFLIVKSNEGITTNRAFIKTLMASRDNVKELWEDSPFRDLLHVDQESQSTLAVKNIDKSKFKFLYAIQGSRAQQQFKHRPKQHEIVDGVIDPIDYKDTLRQKKAYEKLVEEERKKRKEEKEKEKKAQEEKKQKEADEKRKKEEETRKVEEEKKNKKEKEAKELAQKAYKEEQKKLQLQANEEGLKNDADFLKKDMEDHYETSVRDNFVMDQPIVVLTPYTPNKKVIANREEYCQKHGYKCLFPNIEKIAEKKMAYRNTVILRKELLNVASIKEDQWVWFLDANSLITNMDLKVEHLLSNMRAKLSANTRFVSNGNYSPDIRFPSEFTDEQIKSFQMVMARSDEGFNAHSFLIKNTENTRFWLDMLDDHVVAGKVQGDDQHKEGNILQYLYLGHKPLRNRIAVVTPRLLNSKLNSAAAPHFNYKLGDISVAMSCTKCTDQDVINTFVELGISGSEKSSDSESSASTTEEAKKSSESTSSEKKAETSSDSLSVAESERLVEELKDKIKEEKKESSSSNDSKSEDSSSSSEKKEEKPAESSS